MKTIGIIGAMDEEIAGIKPEMDIISTKNIIGLDFIMGKMGGKSVVLVRSGIGKVNAAICAQILINMYGVDYIINVGVAGGINDKLNIGDIVISSDVTHHDFKVSENPNEAGLIPILNRRFFEADEYLIQTALEAHKAVCPEKSAYIGRVASGDQFISSSGEKRRIESLFSAYCVEMEGAAIGHTCTLNKIPFVIIRSISDKADEVADCTFSEFVSESARRASSIVEYMVNAL